MYDEGIWYTVCMGVKAYHLHDAIAATCGEIFFQDLFAQLGALTHLKHLFDALASHIVSLKSPCKLYLNLDSAYND